MLNKYTLMLAVLIPGLAGLAACSRDNADDAAAPVTTTTPTAADTMPMPVDPAPSVANDERSFAEMDKNSDGGITHDEMSDADMLHKHFSVADANGDSKLSESEVNKHRADMAAAPAN